MVCPAEARDAESSALILPAARLDWRGEQPFNLDFDDIYYGSDGLAESQCVYIEGNDLPQRFRSLQRPFFTVGEMGFGTGLNFFLTLQQFLEWAPPRTHLHYVATEALPLRLEDLQRIHARWPQSLLPEALRRRFAQQYPRQLAGFHWLPIHPRAHLLLLWGQAERLLPDLRAQVDAWYWDGFNPAKNPQAFQPELLRWAAKNSAPGATLASFSAARRLRDALEQAGFQVEKKPGFGRKRHRITAQLKEKREDFCWLQALPPQPPGQKIAIVGGGLAGLSSGLALQRHHHPVIFDAGESASAVPRAISHLHLDAKDTPMRRYHLSAWHLARRRYGLLPPGLLQSWPLEDYSLKDGQREALQSWRRIFPDIDGVDVIDTAALRQHLRQNLEFRTARAKIQRQGSGWRVNGEYFDVLLLASGWQTELWRAEWLQCDEASAALLRHALRPIAGHSHHFRGGHLQRVICAQHNLLPDPQGAWVGGSFHPNEADIRPNPAVAAAQEALLRQHAPGEWRQDKRFAGVRGASRDYFPMLGQLLDGRALLAHQAHLRHDARAWRGGTVPAVAGLFIHAALGSKAYSHAWLNAEQLASLLDGSPSPLPNSLLPHLLPQRFILRALSRRQL